MFAQKSLSSTFTVKFLCTAYQTHILYTRHTILYRYRRIDCIMISFVSPHYIDVCCIHPPCIRAHINTGGVSQMVEVRVISILTGASQWRFLGHFFFSIFKTWILSNYLKNIILNVKMITRIKFLRISHIHWCVTTFLSMSRVFQARFTEIKKSGII